MNIEDMSMQEIIDYIHESKNHTKDAYNMRKNLDHIVSQVHTVIDHAHDLNPELTNTVMIDTLLTVLDETGILPRELFFIEFFKLLTDKYKDEYKCMSEVLKTVIDLEEEYKKSQETDEPMSKSTLAMKQMLVLQKYKVRNASQDTKKSVDILGELLGM